MASTGDNAIYSIKDALARWKPVNKGDLVYQDNAHLRGPLGNLILRPNGTYLRPMGTPSTAIRRNPVRWWSYAIGNFVAQYSVDLGGQGERSVGTQIEGDKLSLAAVDDVVNTRRFGRSGIRAISVKGRVKQDRDWTEPKKRQGCNL